jgi:hypothetical protein
MQLLCGIIFHIDPVVSNEKESCFPHLIRMFLEIHTYVRMRKNCIYSELNFQDMEQFLANFTYPIAEFWNIRAPFLWEPKG